MWPHSVAHVLPVEPGEGGHATLVLALVTIGAGLAVLAGVMLGDRFRARWWAAPVAAGALLLLLFDLLKESASLGQGLLSDPLLQAGLLLAFAAGLVLVPLGRTPDALAWLWTLGIALHSAGEGWIVGSEADATDLAGFAGQASYLAHKVIEGFTIPLVAGIALRGRGLAAATVVALATLAAAFAGYITLSGTAPLFLFAAGAGAAAYAALRLGGKLGPREAAMVVVGALAVYGAGLLHEI